jgi:DNA segregation ATPase FtsK/SpoIIIE, S-DNA-T family
VHITLIVADAADRLAERLRWIGPTLSDEALRQAAGVLSTARTVIVVDDCEQITVTPTERKFEEVPTLLSDAIAPPAQGLMGLVLCGNAIPLLDGPQRSLTTVARQVREEGACLLLTPSAPGVAREHGLKLEADQYFTGPPGRGYLKAGRERLLVQVAYFDASSALDLPRTDTCQ